MSKPLPPLPDDAYPPGAVPLEVSPLTPDGLVTWRRRAEMAEARVRELEATFEGKWDASRSWALVDQGRLDALEAAEQRAREAGLTFEEVSRVNRARKVRWHRDDEKWSGADWATALGGEVGEALNIVKKLRRVEAGLGPGVMDPPYAALRQMLAEELADVFMYLDLLSEFYGVDLPAAIVAKFNLVSERQGLPHRLGPQ